jgi:multidrug efflux pump subunit AcrA (membrane-fusion protein)
MADIIVNKPEALTWRNRVRSPFAWVGRKVDRRPMLWFFILLALLTGAIVAGNYLRRPPESSEDQKSNPKEVVLYALDGTPEITLDAKVEKGGVVKIVAQSPGIVNEVFVKEGTKVNGGQQLVRLSTNYQGGNVQTVQRQLAQKNYDTLVSNYDAQKDLIKKRRDIADNIDTQADEMRAIADKSLGDTRATISANEEMLSSLDTQITALEANNTDGSNTVAIAQSKQARAQLLGALAQLRNGLRTAEYQAASDKAPSTLSDRTREVTLDGLTLEEKGLDVQKEIAQLNLRLAQISESLMSPAAPFSGIVERVYVKNGQSVAPGTPIAQVTGNTNSVRAVAFLSGQIADRVSRIAMSKVKIGNELIEILPTYVSGQATDGSLYSITFAIPSRFADSFTDGGNVLIQVPLSVNETLTKYYVPMDAVYQTDSESYLFIAEREENGELHAKEKVITLGNVDGNFVEVVEGLVKSDTVILDRNVVSGDLVKEK